MTYLFFSSVFSTESKDLQVTHFCYITKSVSLFLVILVYMFDKNTRHSFYVTHVADSVFFRLVKVHPCGSVVPQDYLSTPNKTASLLLRAPFRGRRPHTTGPTLARMYPSARSGGNSCREVTETHKIRHILTSLGFFIRPVFFFLFFPLFFGEKLLCYINLESFSIKEFLLVLQST